METKFKRSFYSSMETLTLSLPAGTEALHVYSITRLEIHLGGCRSLTYDTNKSKPSVILCTAILLSNS